MNEQKKKNFGTHGLNEKPKTEEQGAICNETPLKTGYDTTDDEGDSDFSPSINIDYSLVNNPPLRKSSRNAQRPRLYSK